MVPNIHYTELNQSDPILSDINIRKAIGLIIDRADVVDANKDAVIEAQCGHGKCAELLRKLDNYYRETYAMIEQATARRCYGRHRQ